MRKVMILRAVEELNNQATVGRIHYICGWKHTRQTINWLIKKLLADGMLQEIIGTVTYPTGLGSFHGSQTRKVRRFILTLKGWKFMAGMQMRALDRPRMIG
jgi:hypothetical protein